MILREFGRIVHADVMVVKHTWGLLVSIRVAHSLASGVSIPPYVHARCIMHASCRKVYTHQVHVTRAEYWRYWKRRLQGTKGRCLSRVPCASKYKQQSFHWADCHTDTIACGYLILLGPTASRRSGAMIISATNARSTAFDFWRYLTDLLTALWGSKLTAVPEFRG